MKLLDLDPRWVGAGGPGISRADGSPVPERSGVGLVFNCPCGCGTRRYVPFSNPLDGGPGHDDGHPAWLRTGESFDTLTLSPSILADPAKGGCGWHGYIRQGEVTKA